METSQRFRSALFFLNLFAFFFAFVSSDASAQGTEVFPLARGLRYTYAYKGVSGSWTEFSASSRSDSGIVAYQILDSTRVNDTTRSWTIRQTRALTVRYRNSPFPRDTVFFVNDSALFTLNEFLTGAHELQAISLVWDFPIFPNIPVYRFSDSSICRRYIRFPLYCSRYALNNGDSLWFTRDSGMVRRVFAKCSQYGESGTLDSRSSTLVQRILLGAEEQAPIVSQFMLYQNYPNPFNPITRIEYAIPKSSHVTLKVFDLLGKEIATLVDELQNAGFKQIEFNASGLASGVYIYRLQSERFVGVRKFIVMR
jgi:hypothetical protein